MGHRLEKPMVQLEDLFVNLTLKINLALKKKASLLSICHLEVDGGVDAAMVIMGKPAQKNMQYTDTRIDVHFLDMNERE